jgi:hypothetical protein
MTNKFPAQFNFPIQKKKIKIDNDTIVCECGNSWLEVIFLQQFLKDFQVVLGQAPPRKKDFGFYIFRCPKCLKIHQPSIQFGGRDFGQDDYDAFLELIDQPVKEKDDETNLD